MKHITLIFAPLILFSCIKPRTEPDNPQKDEKVLGWSPVYAAVSTGKQVYYTPQKKSISVAGNIYAFGKYIFQVEVGHGIHVIDNTVPASADRIGFINVKGCAQISIRGSKLYTNSYDDLITLDISNPATLHEVHRVSGAFPEFRYYHPLSQPDTTGHFTCPRYDSLVVGWVRDSVSKYSCYKN